MRYFIITYVRKPNGQIDEQVEVSNKVKERDLQMANVIMDFKEKKIQKCVIEGNTVTQDWDTLYNYYNRVYTNIFERLEIEAQQ